MDQPGRRPLIRGRDFVATMASLASAGFGVIAALAWNEAVKALVTRLFPASEGSGGKIVSLFVYAVVVSAFAVFVVSSLARAVERLGGEKKL